jgi:hypothetical protein
MTARFGKGDKHQEDIFLSLTGALSMPKLPSAQ